MRTMFGEGRVSRGKDGPLVMFCNYHNPQPLKGGLLVEECVQCGAVGHYADLYRHSGKTGDAPTHSSEKVCNHCGTLYLRRDGTWVMCIPKKKGAATLLC